MNYKGYCLWADDIPKPSVPHYIIITSDEDPSGNVLIVAISSIKYNEKGDEKYYDKACKLATSDILDEEGFPILTKPSFVRYQYAVEMKTSDILQKQAFKKYKYKTKISEQLLKKIQDGARKSLELEPRFRKYFEFF